MARVLPWEEVAAKYADDPVKLEDARNRYFQQIIAPKYQDAQSVALAREAWDKSTVPQGGGALGFIKDLGVSFASGAGSLVEGAGTAYGLATGDMDNAVRRIGAGARDYWNAEKSDELKALEAGRSKAIDSADGFVGGAKAAVGHTLSDPRLAASFLAEQIPMFTPAGIVGRGGAVASRAAGLAAPTAAKIGTAAAIGTGAVQQGADIGGDTYDEARKALDKDPRTAPLLPEQKDAIVLDAARKSAAVAGVVSLGTNVGLARFGGTAIERMLAGGSGSGKGSLASRLLKAPAGEGLQESAEEGLGDVAKNWQVGTIDPSRELVTSQTGAAAGLGAIAGVGLGAPAGVADAVAAPRAAPPPPPSQDLPAEAPAPAAPAPTGAPAPAAPAGPTVYTEGMPDLSMQNRDRQRAASVVQMQAIAGAPDFDRIGPSNSVEIGAPMVSVKSAPGDGDTPGVSVVGRDESVLFADGTKVPARYAVVEADQVLASNTADGTPVEAYAAPPPGALVALNNARTAGMQEAYRRGTADGYRARLESEAAALGLDAQAIAAMKAPLLVRLYDDAINANKDLGRLSNTSHALQASASERAMNDARMVSPELLDRASPDPLAPGNEAFLAAFLQSVPANERGDLVSADGQPTRQLRQRVNDAVLARAYRSPEIVQQAVEDADPEIQNVLNAMRQAAPVWARIGDMGNLELREPLVRGAWALIDAKRRGLKPAQALAQGDMLGRDPVQDAFTRMFADNIRSAPKMAQSLRAVAERAEAELAGRGDMLGGAGATRESIAGVLSPGDALLDAPVAARRQDTQSGDMFGGGGTAPPERPQIGHTVAWVRHRRNMVGIVTTRRPGNRLLMRVTDSGDPQIANGMLLAEEESLVRVIPAGPETAAIEDAVARAAPATGGNWQTIASPDNPMSKGAAAGLLEENPGSRVRHHSGKEGRFVGRDGDSARIMWDDGTRSVLDARGLDWQVGAAKRPTVTNGSFLRAIAMPVSEKAAIPAEEKFAAAQQKFHVEQSVLAEFRRMYEEAHELYQDYHARVQTVQDVLGGDAIIAPLKGPVRAQEKLLEGVIKGKTPRASVKDLLRATVVVISQDEVQRAVDAVLAKFPGAEIKRNLLTQDAPGFEGTGYHDVLINVPMGKLIAEVQINFPDILDAKEEEGHKLYEQQRKIQDLAKREDRDGTPEELAEVARLKAEQFAIYDPPWLAFNRTRASSAEIGSPSDRAIEGLTRTDRPSGRSAQAEMPRSAMIEGSPFIPESTKDQGASPETLGSGRAGSLGGFMGGTPILAESKQNSNVAGSARQENNALKTTRKPTPDQQADLFGANNGDLRGNSQASPQGAQPGALPPTVDGGEAGGVRDGKDGGTEPTGGRPDGEQPAGAQGVGAGQPTVDSGAGGDLQQPGQDLGRDSDGGASGIPAGRDIPAKSGRNYAFGPSDLTYEGSWFTKARQNVEALKLLRQLEEEKRQATPAEQAVLAKYVGWGAGEIRNKIFDTSDKLDDAIRLIDQYDEAIEAMDKLGLGYLRREAPRTSGSYYGRTSSDPGFYQAFTVLSAKRGSLSYSAIDRITRAELEAAKPDRQAKKWVDLREELRGMLTDEQWNEASRSTQYAHYTAKEIVSGMWDAVRRMGFKGGAVLEPGAGIGVFPGLMGPELANNSLYTGIEFEPVAGGILKQLFPDERIIVGDFIKAPLPHDFYDVAIGNPPFSDLQITSDPEYKKHAFALHDYFFAKTLDRVKPGGLVVFVTSRYTMDKLKDKGRAYLAERADLLGAIRLPQTAFKKNAGTEVVTDVLFLRKKVPGETFAQGQKWMGSAAAKDADGKTLKRGGKEILINEYFAAHPEMVLGTPSLEGTMYAADEYTVKPLPGDIAEHFAKAAGTLPANVYRAELGTSANDAATRDVDLDPKAKKEGGYYLSDKGVLMQTKLGVGHRVDKQDPKLIAYIPLRDALKQALFDQLNDGPWEASLTALQKAYRKWVRVHGRVLTNTPYERTTIAVDEVTDEEYEVTNKYRRWAHESSLRLDPDFSLVRALENVDDVTDEITETKFLSERQLVLPKRAEVRSAPDALLTVLNETGKVDLRAVAAAAGLTEEETLAGLAGQIYRAPSGDWLMADEYLSGNVRRKLQEAIAAAETDKRFVPNVDALRAVQPREILAEEINTTLGQNFIPIDDYQDFAREVLKVKANVTYNRTTGNWYVEPATSWAPRSDYDAGGVQAHKLLNLALSGSPVRVTHKDVTGKDVFDPDATAAAQQKISEMRVAFREWLFKDDARKARLVRDYNETFNTIVPRKFDGKHLTLPGTSLQFKGKIFDHVKRGAWRIIQTGNTYLAHAVGSGKTFQMVISAMEQKRLGLINKPMMVVPNHMLAQFEAEWMQLYPTARLMVADEAAFHTSKRQDFVARAALTDLDGIILTHSAFGLLDLDPAFKQKQIEAEIEIYRAALREAGGDPDARPKLNKAGKPVYSRDPTIRDIEKMLESMRQRLESMAAEKKDIKTARFDEMGVDMLYVDEAHEYRRLQFPTRRSMKGIQGGGAKRSFDMMMKTRWLEEKNPGRSLVMASGTPITNTVAELYTVLRYMAPQSLEERNLARFDDWASMFGREHTQLEPNAAGAYEQVTRFVRFANLPELTQMFREFADVVTGDELAALLGDRRPRVKDGSRKIVVTPMSRALREYRKELKQRMEDSRNFKSSPQDPVNRDPVIRIIGDGRLASVDMRFVDPTMQSDPDSKLNRMADEVIRVYNENKGRTYDNGPAKGAAQIVFSDYGFGEDVAKKRGFNALGWFNKRLRDAGIPVSEIAHINDYKSAQKRLQLFRRVNEGRVKVLIGASRSLGTGTNAQQRLIALHHLDTPWFPAHVEQREGRIIRTGNRNPEVQVYGYSTKGSYDETMWGLVANKQRFIDQAMTGDTSVREIDDTSEAGLYEQAAAMLADDHRVLELAGLRAELERLQRLYRSHQDDASSAAWSVEMARAQVERLEQRVLPLADKLAAQAVDLSGNKFTAKLDGKPITVRKEWGQGLIDRYKDLAAKVTEGGVVVGEISGFPVQFRGRIVKSSSGKVVAYESVVELRATEARKTSDLGEKLASQTLDRAVYLVTGANDDPLGSAMRASNFVADLAAEPARLRGGLESAKSVIVAEEPRINAKFPFLAELVEKANAVNALEADIQANPYVDPADAPPADGLTGIPWADAQVARDRAAYFKPDARKAFRRDEFDRPVAARKMRDERSTGEPSEGWLAYRENAKARLQEIDAALEPYLFLADKNNPGADGVASALDKISRGWRSKPEQQIPKEIFALAKERWDVASAARGRGQDSYKGPRYGTVEPMPEPGDEFIVYRSGEGLRGHNAGTAQGVAAYIEDQLDVEKPSHNNTVADRIHAYRVRLTDTFGDYETLQGRGGSGVVGRNDSIWYSMGGGFEIVKDLGSIETRKVFVSPGGGISSVTGDGVRRAFEKKWAAEGVDPLAARKLRFYPSEQFGPRQGELDAAFFANRLVGAWANKPKVVVYRTMAEAPAEVREHFGAQDAAGAEGAVAAFLWRDAVHLVEDQLAGPADVIRKVMHEGLGHYGLRSLYGRDLARILDELAMVRPAEVRASAKRNGLDMRDPTGRLLAAEELLVSMAESRPELGWVKRAVAAIRTWIRQNVPGADNLRVSDDEIIREWILPARRFVEEGGKPPRGGRSLLADKGPARVAQGKLSPAAMRAIPKFPDSAYSWPDDMAARDKRGDEIEAWRKEVEAAAQEDPAFAFKLKDKIYLATANAHYPAFEESRPYRVTSIDSETMLPLVHSEYDSMAESIEGAMWSMARGSKKPPSYRQIPVAARVLSAAAVPSPRGARLTPSKGVLDTVLRVPTQALKIDQATRAVRDAVWSLVSRITPEKVKAGVLDSYGLPDAVDDHRHAMEAAQMGGLGKTQGILDRLATLTRAEAQVLYRAATQPDGQVADYLTKDLPEDSRKAIGEIKRMVRDLGQEQVDLGLLDADVFKRSEWAYLHRSYLAHEAGLTAGEKRARSAQTRILGDAYRSRGIADSTPQAEIQRAAPAWWGRKFPKGKADQTLIGQNFVRLERREAPLPGMGAGRLLARRYWPAGEPVPAGWERDNADALWTVRSVNGDDVILRRDFTPTERQAMGEIDDIRYALAKTMHFAIHNVETAKYLKWLADNHSTATKETLPAGAEPVEASEKMLRPFGKDEWVQVPESTLLGTSIKKYGPLAGRWVNGPVWNELRSVVAWDRYPWGRVYGKLMSAFKISKTALSPAVHMNNVMANFVMADWQDVGATHLARAVRALADGDKEIVDTYRRNGGQGGSWAITELQRKQLMPLLDSLMADANAAPGPALFGVVAAIQAVRAGDFQRAFQAAKGAGAVRGVKWAADRAIDLYQGEDDLFRLAAFIKAKDDGLSDMAAGKFARDAFLDYRINAPWVQALRQTALPFVAFTYRALPKMLNVIANKPWKVLKLGMVIGAADALGVLLSGADEDEERRWLPEEKAGRMWFGMPKMVRMGWNTNDDPVWLDVRRWIPVGDVVDIGQGHSALPIPPALVPSGPLAVFAEILANRSFFTGKPIVNRETDTVTQQAIKVLNHLFKAFMPNLPIPNPLGYLPGVDTGQLQTFAWQNMQNAVRGRTDVFGREQSAAQAAASAIGIKVGSYGADAARQRVTADARAAIAEVRQEMNKTARELALNGIDREEFDRRMERSRDKLQRISERASARMP